MMLPELTLEDFVLRSFPRAPVPQFGSRAFRSRALNVETDRQEGPDPQTLNHTLRTLPDPAAPCDHTGGRSPEV